MKKTIITLAIVAFTVLAYGQDTETPEYTLKRYRSLEKGVWLNKVDTVWKYKTLYPIGGNRKPISLLEVVIRIEKLEKRIDSLNKPIFYTSSSGLTYTTDCKDSIVVEWKKVVMFSLVNFDKNIYSWQSGWLKEERIVKTGRCFLTIGDKKPTQTYYFADKKKLFPKEVIDYRILK